MQKLAADAGRFFQFAVQGRIPVFGIPGDGMADGGQVRPDLMGTAGNQLDLQDRQTPVAKKRQVARADRKALRKLFFSDRHPVGAGVLYEPAGNLLRGGHGALYHAQVIFPDRPLPDGLRENLKPL